MEMMIDFPGGARVDAHFGDLTLKTDQPPAGGGEGSAPSPFDTFLASIGTCAGIYVLGFCRQRGIRWRVCASFNVRILIPLREWWARSIWRSRPRPVSLRNTCPP